MKLYDVIVVGAGVSGCAAAAELARAGREVLLLNSGLDVVGLPGYGPVLAPAASRPDRPWEGLVQLFAEAAPSIRLAWLRNAYVPLAPALMVVDRRAVSLDVKWFLEQSGQVELRQALVTAIEPLEAKAAAAVEVRTAFEECFQARACIMAVGLALGGRILRREAELHGGRYAEVPADELRADLRARGVGLRRVLRQVGARYWSTADSIRECLLEWPLQLRLGSRNGCGIRESTQFRGRVAATPDDHGSFWTREVPVGAGEVELRPLIEASSGIPDKEEHDRVQPQVQGGPLGLSRLVADAARSGVDNPRKWRAGTAWTGTDSTADGVCESSDVTSRATGSGGPTIIFGPPGEKSGSSSEGISVNRPDQSRPAMVTPLGPHEVLRPAVLWAYLVSRRENGARGDGSRDEWAHQRSEVFAGVFPDGVSTSEWYCSPELAWAPSGGGVELSRPEYSITGDVIVGVEADGTLSGLPGVWVAGQARGCSGYLESIDSGTRAAKALLLSVGR